MHSGKSKGYITHYPLPPPISERLCVEILVGRGSVEVDK